MSRWHTPLPSELHVLLEWESAIPPLPSSVRERAVARARAALAVGRALPSAVSGSVPRIRRALALAGAGATAAAGGAIGYEAGRSHEVPVSTTESTTAVVVSAPLPSALGPGIAGVPASVAATAGNAQSRAETDPEELYLLGEARSAVAARNFAAALVPLNEHARRFENGRLAEEREALLVRTLSGLGRSEQARRAAEAFAGRFPHSVLLTAVRRMASPKP